MKVFTQAPVYRSHKAVRALEIDTAVKVAHGQRVVTFVDPDYDSTTLGPEIFSRYEPKHGDFLVIYNNGYVSLSPRQDFLDGYAAA